MELKITKKQKNDTKKHLKTTSKKTPENITQKLSKSNPNMGHFGTLFEDKKAMDQKGLHSLKPTYSVGETWVRVIQPNPKNSANTPSAAPFFALEKNIKKTFPKAHFWDPLGLHVGPSGHHFGSKKPCLKQLRFLRFLHTFF